jgi:uncharacterized protein YndB with AHSA1/START domain
MEGIRKAQVRALDHNRPDREAVMQKPHVAKVATRIHAPVHKVWGALVSPQEIKQYMFGTTVESDWREGSPITWKGEWQGKHYEDKGVILHIEPQRKLEYSHFSPLSGDADTPENYHTVTIELRGADEDTTVSLSQDNNKSEEAKEHSEKNWSMMLSSLKKMLEA